MAGRPQATGAADQAIETAFEPRDLSAPLLEVTDLQATFTTDDGPIVAVDNVSFTIEQEQVFGIVGESGSGKSTIADSVLDLLPENGQITNGTVRYRGEDVLDMTESRLNDLRGGEVSMIFQDPMSHLNPVYTIGEQLVDVIIEHTQLSKSQARSRAVDLLGDVGLPSPAERMDEYPHEYSGGMRQRALIAMALACDPALIIADEPTTALDVTIQAQILDLLADLVDEYSTSLLFITHNMGIIAQLADELLVLYAGKTMERGTVADVFSHPTHPYTENLLASIPSQTDEPGSKRFNWIDGSPPDPMNRPSGCVFRTRCPKAEEECEQPPPPHEPADGHVAYCHFPVVSDHG